jgi:peptidoglycan hydrolase CwlO-like protein
MKNLENLPKKCHQLVNDIKSIDNEIESAKNELKELKKTREKKDEFLHALIDGRIGEDDIED